MEAAAGGPPQDSVELLYKACRDNEFPADIQCLQTFLFDRCMEWSDLLGLWKGLLVIEHHQRCSYKQQLHEAVAEVRVTEFLEATYSAFNRESKYEGSGYWRWFQQNKTQLSERAHATCTPPRVGRRVQLKGLQARPELNGSAGEVVGHNEAGERFAVKLTSPPSAVAAQPEGVRVKAGNLEVLPPRAARAVLLSGPHMGAAFAFGTRASDGWVRCAVPALLGLPLAYRRMGFGQQLDNEQLAVLLCIDPITGLAPAEIQANGLGTVLVARTDGKDFTTDVNEQLFWGAYLAACCPHAPQL